MAYFLMLKTSYSELPKVGIIGATGLIGSVLLSVLSKNGWKIVAYYRLKPGASAKNIDWRPLFQNDKTDLSILTNDPIDYWVSTAPIWTLSSYFALFQAHQARRIVALSSTSLFTKKDSSDIREQTMTRQLETGECALKYWAQNNRIDWVVLRPTLVYGMARDKNITEIARFIRRFRFFPLFGKALGLRQPVHVHDVADACVAALTNADAKNSSYNLSGAEAIPYQEMVRRVFLALNRKPVFLKIPLFAFRIAIALLKLVPRYRSWSPAMAERMNQNMVFDNAEAERDLTFRPRKFDITELDLNQ